MGADGPTAIERTTSYVPTAVDRATTYKGRLSCDNHTISLIPPPSESNNEGGQLLFEIEHSIETKPKSSGRPVHLYKGAKESKLEIKLDPYKSASDAVVGTLSELLHEVGFQHFSIVVNRRVMRTSEREAAMAFKYPSQVDMANAHDQNDEPGVQSSLLTVGRSRTRTESSARTDRTDSSTTDNPQGGTDDVIQHSPTPPCPRARKTAAARYPRAGAFEITVYDVQRLSCCVLYSKYQKHVLPSRAEDILQDLLPFMVIFAGHSNDEPLMNRLTEFANSRNMIVQLSVNELREAKGTSLLLNFILVALEELCRSLGSGDPDHLDHLMQSVPHALRTVDVLNAERRLEHLLNVERKVSEALSKIEQGYVTSGMESLQRAIQNAQQEGLCGTVMDDGVACLRQAQDPDEDDSDLADAQNEDVPSHLKAVQRASTERSLDIAQFEKVEESSEATHSRHNSVDAIPYESDAEKIEVVSCRSPGYDSEADRRSSRQVSKEITKRISIASKDGKPTKYAKKTNCRTAMEKAENEIIHQKEELDQLKEKLLTAVKDLSITLNEDGLSSCPQKAMPTTAIKDQTADPEKPPQQPKRQNSKELVKAGRMTPPPPCNDAPSVVSQISAELDSLLNQVRGCVYSHRDEAHFYELHLHRAERAHAETQCEAEMEAQELSDRLVEQVRMREQVAARARSVEVQSTVTAALERAIADLQAETASRAQASCDNALRLAVKHETKFYAISQEEARASQQFAREAFWCEVDVCDAALREQSARRAEFADLVECELVMAEAAQDVHSTRENAKLWVADCEAAAERARQEVLACEISSCEAVARESAARHAECEAMAARHAVASEMFTLQLAETDQALVDEQAFAATEIETCKRLSALVVESQEQAKEALAQEEAAIETCKSLSNKMEVSESELHAARERETTMKALAATETAAKDAARNALASADVELEATRCRYQEQMTIDKERNDAVARELQMQEAKLTANRACCIGLVLSSHTHCSDVEQKLDSFAREAIQARSELQSERSEAKQQLATMVDRISEASSDAESARMATKMAEDEVASLKALIANQANAVYGMQPNADLPSLRVGLEDPGRDVILVAARDQSTLEGAEDTMQTTVDIEASSLLSTGNNMIHSGNLSILGDFGSQETGMRTWVPQSSLFSSTVPAPEDTQQRAIIESGGTSPRQLQMLSSAEIQLGSIDRLPQRQNNQITELAAPGEAPFQVQDPNEIEVAQLNPIERNATVHPSQRELQAPLANASRGEAPMSELERECAPGEAPFAVFNHQFVEETPRIQLPIVVSTGDPLRGASTGEAPMETHEIVGHSSTQSTRVQALLPSAVEVERSQEQESPQRGDSTGEAPQTEVEPQQQRHLQTEPPTMAFHPTGGLASHSTGEAPQAELLVTPTQAIDFAVTEGTEASHSIRDPPRAHSTGEAPQAESSRSSRVMDVRIEETSPTLDHGQTSHSTGEAPQVEVPVERPRLPAHTLLQNLSHSTGEMPMQLRVEDDTPSSVLRLQATEARMRDPFGEHLNAHTDEVVERDVSEDEPRRIEATREQELAEEAARQLQAKLEAEAEESRLKRQASEDATKKAAEEEQKRIEEEARQQKLAEEVTRQQQIKHEAEVEERRLKCQAEEAIAKKAAEEEQKRIEEEARQQKLMAEDASRQQQIKHEAEAEEMRLKCEAEEAVAKKAAEEEQKRIEEEARQHKLAEEVAREQKAKLEAEAAQARHLKCQAETAKKAAEDEAKKIEEEARQQKLAEESAKQLQAKLEVKEECLEGRTMEGAEKVVDSRTKRADEDFKKIGNDRHRTLDEEKAAIDSALTTMMEGFVKPNDCQTLVSEASMVSVGTVGPIVLDDLRVDLNMGVKSLMAGSTVVFDAGTDTDDLAQIQEKEVRDAPPKPPRRALSVPARPFLSQHHRIGEAMRERRRTWCNGQSLQTDHKQFLRVVKAREAFFRPLSSGKKLKDAEAQTDAEWNPEVQELRLQWSLLRERCRALERQLRQARGAC